MHVPSSSLSLPQTHAAAVYSPTMYSEVTPHSCAMHRLLKHCVPSKSVCWLRFYLHTGVFVSTGVAAKEQAG